MKESFSLEYLPSYVPFPESKICFFCSHSYPLDSQIFCFESSAFVEFDGRCDQFVKAKIYDF